MIDAGILSVDKPTGITSHDVVGRLRRIAGTRRVGHAGTLDPIATGVLVLAIGRATRLLEYVQGQAKQYRATVRLGQTTATYDAEGEIEEERPFAHLTPAAIATALAPFRGTITQQPPAYSAIKQDGQPLYKLARKGIAVDVPTREVTIYDLTLVSVDLPDVVLDVHCSTGTYIRSLAHDLGAALGCGGHIVALRRTAIGAFAVAESVALDGLTADNWRSYLLPPDTAVAHLPRLDLTATAADQLLLGQLAPRLPAQPPDELVRAYAPDGGFIGIVNGVEDFWKPKKMFPAVV